MEFYIDKKELVMKSLNNKDLLKSIENEILKHKTDYSEKNFRKINEVFRKIIYITPENANIIDDEYINLIGSNNMALYYFENIWLIKLLIKILKDSITNKIRGIFCATILSDLYYFSLDLGNLSFEEYEIEQERMEKMLHPYSDSCFDDFIKQYENMKEPIEVQNEKKRITIEVEKTKEQTFNGIRDWLNMSLRDMLMYKIGIPVKVFKEKVELLDKEEKEKVIELIKRFIDRYGDYVKFDDGKNYSGKRDILKVFREMLEISIEDDKKQETKDITLKIGKSNLDKYIHNSVKNH